MNFKCDTAIIGGQHHAIVDAWPDSLTMKGLCPAVEDAFFKRELLSIEAFGQRFPVIVKEMRRDRDTFSVDVAGERVDVG